MQSEEGNKKVVTSVCGICPGGCGVNVEVVDGKIDRITPIKDHPVGIVCVRGAHGKEIVHSPDRLKYPMARVGEKGDGRFERISWDDALDRIADKLQEIKRTAGPEAVINYVGRGLFDVALVDAFAPPGITNFSAKSIFFPFGSPNNAGCGSLCNVSYNLLAAVPTIGNSMGATYSDYANANLIMAWGANPATDSPPTAMKQIIEAKKRGAKLIAIDHMRSEIATKADRWIPIRSGTDGALALGMLRVVINEGLYDKDFVEKWTVGFDELREYVQSFTPEEVERITRVPADVVVEIARTFAATKPATLSMYTGLEYTNSGVQNIRAVLILYAITGNLDVPGGVILSAKVKPPYNRTDVAPPEGPKPIGYDKYPLFSKAIKGSHFLEVPRAILEGDPYPIKALVIGGASILTGYPNPDLWEKCFAKLDLLVVIDRFLTADAMYADFVLPATTYFENNSYQRHRGFVQLRQRVVEPVGEARSDYMIFVGLANRLGYGHLFPQSEEEFVEFVLRDHPISLDELRRNPQGIRFGKPEQYRKYETGMLRSDRKPGFDTPSGKIEIASSIFAEHGYEPLPKYTEPIEGPLANPELAKRYPLILNTGARIQSTFRSQHLNIPGLLKMQPKPHVLINPQDAAARGIKDGDRVLVKSPRGQVPFYANVTDDVVPGGVEVNVGGGGPLQPREWREANTNYLTDADNRDPISGFPVFKALLCDVQKASEG